ncbi:amidase [Micromonospora sp. LOL_023]|uniref:amidase n=1 Tax=Micromonospora sp. LOL_023 TaxID=3345418 RepID=UPI003A8492F3
MKLYEYACLDAVGLRELLRGGELRPAEVEDLARRAIEQVDPDLNALTGPLFDQPLTSDPDGPLAGVPFLLKDSGPFARGVAFSLGSRAIHGAVAGEDHDLMARFRAAGLATLGKTTVPELGLSFATESARHGPTRNPWDMTRGVGGSSGGAAALVAAGAVPLAHGNDGGGSIRVPASCCGLVGLKPSRGRTPCGPQVGEAGFGQIIEFGLCRTVRDVAHLLDAVSDPPVGDKYVAPPPGRPYTDELRAAPGVLRVAVMTKPWAGTPVLSQVADIAVTTAHVLEWIGHTVVKAAPAVDAEDIIEASTLAVATTGAALLRAPHDAVGLEAVSRRILVETRRATAMDIISATEAQHRVTRPINRFFLDHDLLVTPTLAQLPAPHGTLSLSG